MSVLPMASQDSLALELLLQRFAYVAAYLALAKLMRISALDDAIARFKALMGKGSQNA